MITPAGLRRFQKLWWEHYGEKLSDERAAEFAELVLSYVALVLEEDSNPRERGPP